MNKLLPYFLILFFTGNCYAQIYLGVIGGVNRTSLSGDDPPNSSFSTGLGYKLGANSDFYIYDDIVLNFQALLTSYTSYLSYDVDYQYEQYDSIKTTTSYLEFPINVKIISANQISYVTAGVGLGYLLDSKTKNRRTGKKIDSKEHYSEFNIRANFGVGIKFKIGVPIFFFELRYSQSLTNITDQKILELDINRKLKSNGISLATGIMFPL